MIRLAFLKLLQIANFNHHQNIIKNSFGGKKRLPLGRVFRKPDSNVCLITNGICEMLDDSLRASQLPLLVSKSISTDILLLRLNETK